MMTEDTKTQKAGRVLSERNRTVIQEAIDGAKESEIQAQVLQATLMALLAEADKREERDPDEITIMDVIGKNDRAEIVSLSKFPLKAYIDTENNQGVVEGLGIRYGSPEEVDLAGEWFSKKTWFGHTKGSGSEATLNHRVPLVHRMTTKGDSLVLEGLAKRQFTHPIKTYETDEGILVRHVLELSDAFEATVYNLAKEGKFRWSSATSPHMFEKNFRTGEITMWPIIEVAYTPTPCEPRLPTIAPVKSMQADLLPREDGTKGEEGSPVTDLSAKNGEAEIGLGIKIEIIDEGENMTTGLEQTISQLTETIKAQQAMQATQQAMQADMMKNFTEVVTDLRGTVATQAAYIESLKSEPAIKHSPVQVIRDEAERTFESLGAQLLAIKKAAHKPDQRDRRLDFINERALKSMKATTSNEQVNSEGGFFLQDDFERDLNRYMYEQGQITKACRRTTVTGNSLSYLALDETSRAYGSRYGGISLNWQGEGQSYTETRPKIKKIRIELEKLTGLHRVSDELLEDVPAFTSITTELFREAFTYEIQEAIVRGSGSGQPLGILKCDALVTVVKDANQPSQTINMKNILNMWSRSLPQKRDKLAWYVNVDIEPQLYALEFAVGTGGIPAFLPPGGLSNSPYATLLGRPIVPIEQASTLGTVGDIILANFDEYRLVDKGGVQFATSIHAYFDTGEQAFRYTYRMGGRPTMEAPITPANGSNTLSAFVALATRS